MSKETKKFIKENGLKFNKGDLKWYTGMVEGVITGFVVYKLTRSTRIHTANQVLGSFIERVLEDINKE